MPKIYVGEITKPNLKLLQEIVEQIIIQNYAKGDVVTAAKKIIRVFLIPENSLKPLKK